MLPDEKIDFAFKKGQSYTLIAYIADSSGQAKFISTNSHWSHAEVACINKVIAWQRRKYLSEKKIARFWAQHTLVVLRYTPGMRTLSPSKPCKSCVHRIRQYPIKRVVFVNTMYDLESARPRDLKDDYITSYDRNVKLLN